MEGQISHKFRNRFVSACRDVALALVTEPIGIVEGSDDVGELEW